jgi:hypothetical protein
MTYIFLDSNVILIYSVKIDYPDGKVIEHPHYQRLEPFFRVLIQAIQKGGARVIESLTVFDECEHKIDKVVEDSIEKTRNATEGYLDFISLIRNKARKRLKDFLEMVDKPPIDVEQRDKIKKEKVIPLHTTLISENKIPMDRRWSDNDIKILADATYLLQKNKYAPFYFCTTETCLVVGKRTKASRETTTIHIQDLIYPTLGFNTYFPNDIIPLI